MVARPMFVACGRTLQPGSHPLRSAAFAGGSDHPFGLQGAQQGAPEIVQPRRAGVSSLVPALGMAGSCAG
jgi:hypothetical protein